jgi:7-cyano-7-deazaguanine synthase in queuosine biosynthesis
LPKKVWSLKNPGFNWQTCQRESNPFVYFGIDYGQKTKDERRIIKRLCKTKNIAIAIHGSGDLYVVAS